MSPQGSGFASDEHAPTHVQPSRAAEATHAFKELAHGGLDRFADVRVDGGQRRNRVGRGLDLHHNAGAAVEAYADERDAAAAAAAAELQQMAGR